jgi:hypothetical protein
MTWMMAVCVRSGLDGRNGKVIGLTLGKVYPIWVDGTMAKLSNDMDQTLWCASDRFEQLVGDVCAVGERMA